MTEKRPYAYAALHMRIWPALEQKRHLYGVDLRLKTPA